MAISLVTATANVRTLLNEPTAKFWSDSEIQTWIQEGTRIVSSKMLGIEADDNITLSTGKLIYTSSDSAWIGDCIEPYAALYNDGSGNYKGLQFIHPKQIGNVMTFTDGPPRYYSFHNRSFYIWPLPSSAENTLTVYVLYSKESDDITELKDELQHLAIQWALSRAKQKDMKFGEAAALQQEFFSELNFERADKLMRSAETTQDVKKGTPAR